MKPRLSPTLIIVALLLAGAQTAATAEKFTDRIEETYATGASVDISLANTNGSVSVEAWDGDSVQLIAEKKVEASNSSEAQEALAKIDIIIRQADGRLEIETKLPSATQGVFDWLFGRARGASVRYELRVPRSADLDLRSVNGNVVTEGNAGRQLLHTTNGRIEVEGAAHGVEARTTNGSIRVEITDAPSRSDIELGSVNGGITLYLPDTIAGRIKARTVNGSVKTELPVTIDGSTSRRRLNGSLNGGGPNRIELSTTNGSIRINESAGR